MICARRGEGEFTEKKTLRAEARFLGVGIIPNAPADAMIEEKWSSCNPRSVARWESAAMA